MLSSNKKFSAFTLAEVLITLAIIGVVASLTISVMFKNYQKVELYSQFIKAYNTLTTAFQLAQAEYGSMKNWNLSEPNIFERYVVSKMKVIRPCNSFSECFNPPYKMLNGEFYPIPGPSKGFELQGGMSIAYMLYLRVEPDIDIPGDEELDALFFMFDTNGKRGPNVIGRDLFISAITSNGQDYILNESIPYYIVMYLRNYISQKAINELTRRAGDPNNFVSSCDPSYSIGFGCMRRLIMEKSMNY